MIYPAAPCKLRYGETILGLDIEIRYREMIYQDTISEYDIEIQYRDTIPRWDIAYRDARYASRYRIHLDTDCVYLKISNYTHTK